MKFAVSPYTLKASHGNREGSLLKVHFADGKIGYADCHPWPEVGDAPLKDQLSTLQENRVTDLTRRSIFFARLDASARAHGANLFNGLTIPISHLLIPKLVPESLSLIQTKIQDGFTHFKIKMGSDLSFETPILTEVLKSLPAGVKIRLDFNAKIGKDAFIDLLDKLSEWQSAIEFYEDPFAWDPEAWEEVQKKGCILACDHQSNKAIARQAAVLVMKPAIQDERPFLERLKPSQQLVITCYLDHPLGQLCAAFVAAYCALKVPQQMLTCGLLAHHIYQPNSFSEVLASQGNGPVLPIPSGTGFGFDELLENQPWKGL